MLEACTLQSVSGICMYMFADHSAHGAKHETCVFKVRCRRQ
jgi:hypothetical protein